MLRWNEHVANKEATRALRPTTHAAFHNYPLERAKGPCKYKKYIKIQKKFGYDTPHPPTPLSKKKKFRKISKVCNQEYLYIEAKTKA